MHDGLADLGGVDGFEAVALLVGGVAGQLAAAHQLHLRPLGRRHRRARNRLVVAVVRGLDEARRLGLHVLLVRLLRALRGVRGIALLLLGVVLLSEWVVTW